MSEHLQRDDAAAATDPVEGEVARRRRKMNPLVEWVVVVFRGRCTVAVPLY